MEMRKPKPLPDKSNKISSQQKSQLDAAISEKQISSGEIISKIQGISAFSGPLPPPEVLEHYNKIIPNGADRLLKMVEWHAEHRRAYLMKGLEASISITKRGQLFAFCSRW
jgi:uncharacterized membrane protein